MFANVISSTPKHNAFPSVHVPLQDLPPFSIARCLTLLGWWWKSVFQLLLLEKIARNLIILKPSSDDISYVCFEQNDYKRWNLSQSGTYTRLPRPPPDFKPTTIDFSNNSVRSPSWWSSHWLIYDCELIHFYILQAMCCQDIESSSWLQQVVVVIKRIIIARIIIQRHFHEFVTTSIAIIIRLKEMVLIYLKHRIFKWVHHRRKPKLHDGIRENESS